MSFIKAALKRWASVVFFRFFIPCSPCNDLTAWSNDTFFRDEVVHLLAFELHEEELKHELEHSCLQRYAHVDRLFNVGIQRQTHSVDYIPFVVVFVYTFECRLKFHNAFHDPLGWNENPPFTVHQFITTELDSLLTSNQSSKSVTLVIDSFSFILRHLSPSAVCKTLQQLKKGKW